MIVLIDLLLDILAFINPNKSFELIYTAFLLLSIKP